MNLETIFTLATGGFVTAAITYLFNKLEKRAEHNRELVKMTYAKKIEAAEDATAFYSTMLVSLIEIKKSHETLIYCIENLEEAKHDPIILQASVNAANAAIGKLINDNFLQANKIHLYFNLIEKDNWNETHILSFYKSATEIKSLDSELALYNEKLGFEFFATSNGKLLLKNFVEALGNLVKNYDIRTNAIISNIATIRQCIHGVNVVSKK